MAKHSVTNRILTNAANHVVSERGQYLKEFEDELVLPDNPHERTLEWYYAVLDRACVNYFLYGDDDKIFEVLRNAKEHNVRIQEFFSIPTKSFLTYNVYVRKATLFWENSINPKVRMFTNFGSILITKSKVIAKGNVKSSEALKKVERFIQETLGKIEELL